MRTAPLSEFVTKQGEILRIDIGTATELAECSEFVRQNFFPMPPLDLLAACDQEKNFDFIDDLLIGCLQSGVSLIVRNHEGNIVAVGMNETSHRDKPSKMPEVHRFDLAVLDALNENIDLFKKYNTDKLLAFVLVTVDQRYGRQGLAGKLLDLSTELAVSAGVGAVVMEAVSTYAARAAFKKGFEIVNSIDYSTFEFDGQIPLAGKRDVLGDHLKAYLVARPLLH